MPSSNRYSDDTRLMLAKSGSAIANWDGRVQQYFAPGGAYERWEVNSIGMSIPEFPFGLSSAYTTDGSFSRLPSIVGPSLATSDYYWSRTIAPNGWLVGADPTYPNQLSISYNTNVGATNLFATPFPVNGGDVIRVTLEYKRVTLGDPTIGIVAHVGARLQWTYGDVSDYYYPGLPDGAAGNISNSTNWTGEWQTSSYDYSIPAGTKWAKFYFYVLTGSGATEGSGETFLVRNMLIDRVSAAALNTQPIPTINVYDGMPTPSRRVWSNTGQTLFTLNNSVSVSILPGGTLTVEYVNVRPGNSIVSTLQGDAYLTGRVSY